MRRILAISLILSATTLSLPALAAQPAPRSSVGVTTNIPIPANIWNMSFTDSSGATHRLSELKGTTLLVPFLTLCPDVCPFTTGNAIQTARLLQSHHSTNVRVIEVTVDPKRDTVKRLKKYRSMIGLTGTDVAISLWRASSRDTTTMMKFFGMTTEKVAVDEAHLDWLTNKPIAYELDHSDGFYVLSSSGRLRFVSGLSARFTGTLTKAFASYLNDMGRQTLARPGKGWTPNDAVTALSYIANKKL